MKILLVIDQLGIGGAESHVLQLARGLAALGEDVTLASGGSPPPKLCHLSLPLPSHNPLKLLRAKQKLCRLLRTEHFDIVHAHARIPALLIKGCQKYGSAPIVTAHAHFRVDPLLSRICYWGTHTIAVSDDLGNYLVQAYRLPHRQISVIPNGIDMKLFSPAPEKRHPDRLTLVFASRLDRDCSLGAELLCQLAPTLRKKHPRLLILLAGGGEAFPRVSQLAARANAQIGSETVKALGNVLDMPSLLQSADVFVGVSRAAIEAAACGCAVVLCGNEGFLGVLDRSSAPSAQASNFCARGYPLPTECKLLDALLPLLDEPSQRNRMATEGREWVLSRCNADITCRETLALYRQARLSKSQKRVVIGGYFGCGNLGDDAVLEGLLHELRHKHTGLTPIVLSGSPRLCKRSYKVLAVWRKNPFSILCALCRTDLFMLGGGSLLQSVTSRRSLWYYLALLSLCRLLKKPCCLFAAGLGPFAREKDTRLVARHLSHCRYISLRDAESHRLLQKLGVDGGLLHLSADAALLNPPLTKLAHSNELCRFKLDRYHSGRKILCIVLKGGTREAELRSLLLAAARIVCREQGADIIFAVFDIRNDRTAAEQAQKELGASKLFLCRSPVTARALLLLSTAVVTMRLHAMVLATAEGIPALGIGADPREGKLISFAKQSGQPFLGSVELNVPTLADAMSSLLSREPKKHLLRQAADEMQKIAQKDLANIAEMIYNIR